MTFTLLRHSATLQRLLQEAVVSGPLSAGDVLLQKMLGLLFTVPTGTSTLGSRLEQHRARTHPDLVTRADTISTEPS